MTPEQEYALVKLVFDMANNPYIGHPSYKEDLMKLAEYIRTKLQNEVAS